jgi:hypothetical protein
VRKFAILLFIAALVCAAGQAAADQGRFFLRAGAGFNIPYLTNLHDELEFQGTKNAPRLGPSFAVSLGRTFPANQWSLEAHFSLSFNPEFDYRNPNDSFPGHLEHYDFGVILRRNLLPGVPRLQPWLGAGAGAGITNLINGGGKFTAAEAIFVGRIESEINDNLCFAAEATYYLGLQTKPYKQPFLENVPTDVVLDSGPNGGKQLQDRYRSLDVRIGITVYLKAKTVPEY